MRLSFRVPLNHFEELEPYCDFFIISPLDCNYKDYLWKVKSTNKPILFVVSKDDTFSTEEKVKEGIFIGAYEFLFHAGATPSSNIELMVKRSKALSNYPMIKHGIWKGEKHHLKELSLLVEKIWLPWYEPRGLHLNQERGNIWNSRNFNYLGFKNLDELRRLPPAELLTNIPITASIMGIDLTTRERRPKYLPPLTKELTLSRATLDLIKHNLEAIKESTK